MLTRRELGMLFIPQLGKFDNEAYLLNVAWQEFGKVWNPFAEQLNAGVWDNKLWTQVKKKWVGVGGCK